MAEDPYKVLGVPRDAPDEDIRRQYRKLDGAQEARLIALLDRLRQGRGLVVVLDNHLVGLGRIVARVLRVGGEHGLLAGLVGLDLVAAGADRLVARLDLVRRVLRRDDRRASRGEQERPG